MPDSVPSEAELRKLHCLERVDHVSGNAPMTAFRRAARLQQARWRKAQGLSIGTQPIQPKKDGESRKLGSRIPFTGQITKLSNFLGEPVRAAVKNRVDSKVSFQTLKTDRLYCDLLSSMPMCFNLFGWFHKDQPGLNQAVRTLWPAAPGKAQEICFEWSPGRRDPAYLGNQTAFDAAIRLECPGGHGLVGIETKYHEHCKAEKQPPKDRLRRYREVANQSGIFNPGAIDTFLGTSLQQIWLDHLLVLSMLQHKTAGWKWARFVLIYPSKNVSYAGAAKRYADLLADSATFEFRTLESILDAHVLPQAAERAFRDRYIW